MEQIATEALLTSRRDASIRPADSGRRLMLRLVCLAFCVAVVSSTLSVFLQNHLDVNGAPFRLALDSFLLSVYCGVSWYAWMRFRGGRELRWGLTATAFCVMFCEKSLHVAEGIGLHSHVLQRHDAYVEIALLTLVGTLLWAAGRSQRVVRRMRVRWTVEHVVAVCAVGGVVYLAGPHVSESIRNGWRLAVATNEETNGMLAAAFYYGMLVVIAAAFTGAVVAHARRSVTTGDRQSEFTAYWCVAAGLSPIYGLTSARHFDGNWWASVLVSGIAGVILLGALNSENGRAFVEVEEKLGELEVLHALSWKLVGTGTLEALVEAFAWALAEHLRADVAAVFIYEPEENGLRLSSVAGHLHLAVPGLGKVHSLSPQRRPGFHSGHTVRAFHSGEIVVVDDIFADVEFLPWQLLAQQEGMVVSVPIIYSDELLGVYDLYFPSRDRIPQDRARLFKTIAEAAGVAIQHVRIRQVVDRQMGRVGDAAA